MISLSSLGALTTRNGVHAVLNHHFIEQVADGSHGNLQPAIGGHGRKYLIVQIVLIPVRAKVDRGGGGGRRRGEGRRFVGGGRHAPRIDVPAYVAERSPSVGRGRTPSPTPRRFRGRRRGPRLELERTARLCGYQERSKLCADGQAERCHDQLQLKENCDFRGGHSVLDEMY